MMKLLLGENLILKSHFSFTNSLYLLLWEKDIGKISIGQYKRSYERYLLEVNTPNLSFTDFVEARKQGYEWQY
mgnify:CR=1 FL=1